MAGNDGSREFGRTRPHKQHLVRGSGGVQAEITDLRHDVDIAFCAYELGGQLAPYRIDVVPPTVLDDITQGFVPFSKWIDSVAGREYTCISPSTGAAVWSETTNIGVVPGGIVASVFGRVGIVTAAIGDYAASLVSNDSSVAGATVKDALDALLAAIPPSLVTSIYARTGNVVALPGDYAATQVTNDSSVAGAFVANALDTLQTSKVPVTRTLIAGLGLSGGGDLTANRTFNVAAHPDGSVVVNLLGVQVGVLATDAQHGLRGGGSLHSVATPVSSGFMSFFDKVKLDNITPGAQPNTVTSVFGRIGAVVGVLNDYPASLIANDSLVPGATVKAALDYLLANEVPATRQVIAGAGLTGGGNLSADRTFDVVAHVDGSIVVTPDSVQVGILATDAQHGSRGGGTLHALATIASAGFMSAVDKVKLDSIGGGADSIWQEPVLDKDLSAPPMGPMPNDRYIVAAVASGAWTGQENNIAQWTGAVWAFIPPAEGMTAYLVDEDLWYTYNTSWTREIVHATRLLIAGTGLTGGGDLSADRTFNVVANADGSIVANANDIQVGVLATDAQHGNRGGGAQHELATALVSGFMSAADFSKLSGLPSSAVPTSRTLTAGAGMTGGGDLSADRTFDVVAHVDGSIVVNANDLQVGILATDAQHGVRGGGTQHAVVTTLVDGFMSAADKTKLDGVVSGAAALTANAPVNVTKSAAVVGVGTTAARDDHKHDITTAVAIELTDSTNAEGAATSLARSNHTHAHGNRGGGSLHALVVAAGAAGFMSGADKTRLNEILTAVQARRSTTISPAGTFADITFDVTDVETNAAILNHDLVTDTDRILVGRTGLYAIWYQYVGSANGSGTQGRVRVNDTTVLNGSDLLLPSAHNQTHHFSNTRVFLASLTSGDFISLQMQQLGAGASVLASTVFGAVYLG